MKNRYYEKIKGDTYKLWVNGHSMGLYTYYHANRTMVKQ